MADASSAILFTIGLWRAGIKSWVKYAILRVRMFLCYAYALVKTRLYLEAFLKQDSWLFNLLQSADTCNNFCFAFYVWRRNSCDTSLPPLCSLKRQMPHHLIYSKILIPV